MTTALRDVDYELLGRIVSGLRAAPALRALLFPADNPSLDVLDTRVYADSEELPVEPINLRQVLPRVLVRVMEDPFDTEQDHSATPLARALVAITVLVEAGQRDVGEQMLAEIRVILGSTQWSDSNIMVAALVPGAKRQPVRESAFRDAWRFQREWRSELVGVTANG